MTSIPLLDLHGATATVLMAAPTHADATGYRAAAQALGYHGSIERAGQGRLVVRFALNSRSAADYVARDLQQALPTVHVEVIEKVT